MKINYEIKITAYWFDFQEYDGLLLFFAFILTHTR